MRVSGSTLLNAVTQSIAGRVALTEAVVTATALSVFAAVVGYLAVQGRENSESAERPLSKTRAIEVSVALGLVTFVIWLTVLIGSTDSKRAVALALPAMPLRLGIRRVRWRGNLRLAAVAAQTSVGLGPADSTPPTVAFAVRRHMHRPVNARLCALVDEPR